MAIGTQALRCWDVTLDTVKTGIWNIAAPRSFIEYDNPAFNNQFIYYHNVP